MYKQHMLFFAYSRCDICIDVHPNSTHIHHHHHAEGLIGLEDDLVESSMTSGDHPGSQDCPEITEVDVEVDQTVIVSHSHPSGIHPPPGTSAQGFYPPPQQKGHINRHHHHSHYHQHQSSSSRFPTSDNSNHVSSSRQYQHGPNALQQTRPHTGVHQSHSQSHLLTQQGHPQYHHHPNTSPQQQQQLSGIPLNTCSAAGGLLMVKAHQQNGSPSGSNSTTPLTNVSPNLSNSSANSPKGGLTEDGEIIRKRLYRVGLNLFNKKPEAGITYLVKKKFLEGSPPAVSKFLISRKGLSKQMIGEYLTNLQSPFSMSCLE